MNKQLIKKYKTEFDHWLNDGSLLMANSNIKTWITLPNNTWNIKEPCIDNLLIVINDEYVELRKALAEGKTIQFHYVNPTIGLDEWQTINSINSLTFSHSIDLYRIKPEEPQFKEGDIVIKKGVCAIKGPYKIVATVTRMVPRDEKLGTFNVWTTNGTYFDSELELWKPKPGEWCWFYKKNSKNPVFAKFVKLLDSNLGKFEAHGFTPNGTDKEDYLEYGYFYTCSPFIGELPYEN